MFPIPTTPWPGLVADSAPPCAAGVPACLPACPVLSCPVLQPPLPACTLEFLMPHLAAMAASSHCVAMQRAGLRAVTAHLPPGPPVSREDNAVCLAAAVCVPWAEVGAVGSSFRWALPTSATFCC